MPVIQDSRAPGGWGIDSLTRKFTKLQPAITSGTKTATGSPVSLNLPPSPSIASIPKQRQQTFGNQTAPSGVNIVQKPNLPQGYGVDPRTGRIAKVGSYPLELSSFAGGAPDALGRVGSTVETVRDKFPEFNFDEAFARRGVEQEVTPFYQERIKDFLSKYETGKSRAEEDVARALAEIDEDEKTRTEEEAKTGKEDLENVDEGFARRGLFYSGARDKARNRLSELKGTRESSIARELARRKSALTRVKERTLGDQGIARSQYERDVGRSQEEAILELLQRRRQEALNQYLRNIAGSYGTEAASSLAPYYY